MQVLTQCPVPRHATWVSSNADIGRLPGPPPLSWPIDPAFHNSAGKVRQGAGGSPHILGMAWHTQLPTTSADIAPYDNRTGIGATSWVRWRRRSAGVSSSIHRIGAADKRVGVATDQSGACGAVKILCQNPPALLAPPGRRPGTSRLVLALPGAPAQRALATRPGLPAGGSAGPAASCRSRREQGYRHRPAGQAAHASRGKRQQQPATALVRLSKSPLIQSAGRRVCRGRRCCRCDWRGNLAAGLIRLVQHRQVAL